MEGSGIRDNFVSESHKEYPSPFYWLVARYAEMLFVLQWQFQFELSYAMANSHVAFGHVK